MRRGTPLAVSAGRGLGRSASRMPNPSTNSRNRASKLPSSFGGRMSDYGHYCPQANRETDMETFVKDLKHSLRMFAQSPAFTIAAVAALTLGIGVNTAIFSVVNAVLLRPVSVPDPDRLVLFMTDFAQGEPAPIGSPAKLEHYRQQTGVAQDVAAFRTGVVNYTGGTFPEQLPSAQVSADFFRLFGAAAVRGRTFTAEEDRPGGGRVAVLGHRFWARRFGRDPDVVGKMISLSGEPYTIVGVLSEFNFEEFGPTPQ